MENFLKYSEQFFELSQDGILILHNNRFVACNAVVVKMLCYSNKASLLQTHPSELSPEFQPDGKESFQKAEEMMQICLREGKQAFEWVHQKANGVNFWVEVVLTRIDTPDGVLIHVSWRDIDERKRLELELKQQMKQVQNYLMVNEKYKYIIETYKIVSKSNAYGEITYVNDAFCKISGYSRRELIGNSHNIIRNQKTANTLFKELWQTITAGKVWEGTLCNRTKMGEDYYVNSIIVPMMNSEGTINEYVSIREDITNLVQMKEQALELERSKDELLSRVSHELRTPLNGIKGFAQLLSHMRLSTKASQYSQLIEKESVSLLTLINELLDSAKVKSEHFELTPVLTNLFLFLAYEIRFFELQMQEKEIVFIKKIDANLPEWILIDMQRLKQVLHNILNNAIKYTPVKGRIFFEVSQINHGAIRFSVQDSGPGIDDAMQHKIFEAFEQVQYDGINLQSGTGLGLEIASTIVNHMGSKIEIQSTINKGSDFHFTLMVNEVDNIESLAYKQIETSFFLDTIESSQLFQTFLERFNLPLLQVYEKGTVVLCDCGAMQRWVDNGANVIVTQACDGKDDNILATGIDNVATLYELLFQFEIIEHTAEESNDSYALTVLVAEDYETNQLLIENMLKSFGCEVVMVKDGRVALECLKKRAFDIVLADINMPNIDGYQLAEILTLQESKTPIYAVTADHTIEQNSRFNSAHFSGIVYKPIHMKELGAVLQRHTNTKVAPKETPNNVEALFSALNIPAPALKIVLTTYVENASSSIEKIEVALKRNEDELIGQLAHKLKGSSGTVGDNTTYEAMIAIEKCAKNYELDKIAPYCAVVKNSLCVLCEKLKEL